jgi:4,5-DOPA dioxygenase extradiol
MPKPDQPFHPLWDQPDLADDWAMRFDDAVAEQMGRAPEDILRVSEHADFALAVPTPDHFIPLLYIAGLAAAEGTPAGPLVRGYAMGSVSMTCYSVGAQELMLGTRRHAAALPAGAPSDQTNM